MVSLPEGVNPEEGDGRPKVTLTLAEAVVRSFMGKRGIKPLDFPDLLARDKAGDEAANRTLEVNGIWDDPEKLVRETKAWDLMELLGPFGKKEIDEALGNAFSFPISDGCGGCPGCMFGEGKPQGRFTYDSLSRFYEAYGEKLNPTVIHYHFSDPLAWADVDVEDGKRRTYADVYRLHREVNPDGMMCVSTAVLPGTIGSMMKFLDVALREQINRVWGRGEPASLSVRISLWKYNARRVAVALERTMGWMRKIYAEEGHAAEDVEEWLQWFFKEIVRVELRDIDDLYKVGKRADSEEVVSPACGEGTLIRCPRAGENTPLFGMQLVTPDKNYPSGQREIPLYPGQVLSRLPRLTVLTERKDKGWDEGMAGYLEIFVPELRTVDGKPWDMKANFGERVAMLSRDVTTLGRVLDDLEGLHHRLTGEAVVEMRYGGEAEGDASEEFQYLMEAMVRELPGRMESIKKRLIEAAVVWANPVARTEGRLVTKAEKRALKAQALRIWEQMQVVQFLVGKAQGALAAPADTREYEMENVALWGFLLRQAGNIPFGQGKELCERLESWVNVATIAAKYANVAGHQEILANLLHGKFGQSLLVLGLDKKIAPKEVARLAVYTAAFIGAVEKHKAEVGL